MLYEEDFATYDHEKKGFGRIRISVDETGMACVGNGEMCRASVGKASSFCGVTLIFKNGDFSIRSSL